MLNQNTIKITDCDNQLILLALQANGTSSYEICNIQSGNNNPVDVQIQIISGNYDKPVVANGVNKPLNAKHQVTLPKGEYKLVYAGVNWGGPYDFKFKFNDIEPSLPNDPDKHLYGVVWAKGDRDISFIVD